MVPDPFWPTRGISSPKWGWALKTTGLDGARQNPVSPFRRFTPHCLGQHLQLSKIEYASSTLHSNWPLFSNLSYAGVHCLSFLRGMAWRGEQDRRKDPPMRRELLINSRRVTFIETIHCVCFCGPRLGKFYNYRRILQVASSLILHMIAS